MSYRSRAFPPLVAVGLVGLLAGCGKTTPAAPPGTATTSAPTALPLQSPAAPPSGPIASYGYEVVNTFPHDRTAFTQGLVYLQGILLESTGLYGHSSLRKVELNSGKIRDIAPLDGELFGEGMTVLNDKIYLLTWQSHRGFQYNLQTLTREKEFAYDTEGWGLTTDGSSLIMSDGTNLLRYLDPHTFKVTRTVAVFQDGRPLTRLNELEFIKGEIFANVWQTNRVVRIDPTSGRLLGVIDFSGLLAPGDSDRTTDVLNGIAYDSSGERIFVTGKNWPKLFEVRLLKK